jgi:hypothetical protein
MKLKLANGRRALPSDIATLETILGGPPSPDFIDFVRENDGAEPETNIFRIDAGNESGVTGFIPMCKIVEEMRHIENLPEKSFPIAWAEGGNYVLINQAGGAVFFWDHERPDMLIRLGDSFLAFLELLKPFDVSSIKLKPDQVKRAWIDPDFLKSLGE